MFDDWSYREHFDTPRRRERAVSIVQSVASHKSSDGDWVLPVVEKRVRANSVPAVQAVLRPPIDAPLLPGEKTELNDWRKWVGPECAVDDFDDVVFAGQVAAYQTIFERVQLATRVYSALTAESATLLEHIDVTKANLESISGEIVEMRVAADGGIHEQEQLDQLHGDLVKSLRIYDNLETATKALNRPGNKLVGKVDEFAKLLERLDEGLAFCKAHPDFKDMDLYEMRHNQCIARAVSLAQDFCVAHLRKVTGSILQKLTAATATATGTMHALVWAKFEADAELISPILGVIQSRQDSAILDAFAEIQRQYFTCRSQLLSQELARCLAPLAPPGLPDFVSGVQNLLVQFVGLFDKEAAVYRKVVGEPDDRFEQWLTDLCQPLYDQLRRYIIRETDITRLCQLIIAVQSHETSAFEPIFRDAQNRLVFRADLIVDGILKYRAGPKDWGKDVYPTVSQALDLLSQVYQLLNNEVFNNLAHRCVQQCIISLENAHNAATTRLGALEGCLFHIQQLVLLQTRIMDFNVEHSVEHDVDFSGLQTFFEAFWHNRSTMTSFRDLFGMAWTSMPHVIEHMIDAMEGLYAALRLAVTRFTESALAIMVTPIAKNDAQTVPRDVSHFRETVTVELKRINTLVHEHISEPRVSDVLLDSLQEELIAAYGEYYRVVYHTASPDVLEGVMDTDAMVAWLGELARQLHT